MPGKAWQDDLPRFVKGERLKAGKLNELVNQIATLLRGKYGFGVFRPLNIIGKLDAELVAATNFATTPATAVMSVWIKNSSGDMEDSGRNETITNRFVNMLPIASGTIVKAEWIEGEWQLYASDC